MIHTIPLYRDVLSFLKANLIEIDTKMEITRGWEVGEMRYLSKGTNFGYKISKFGGSNVQHGDYS